MKKTFLKTIGGAALAILMLAIFAQVWVSAQDKSNEMQNSVQTLKDLSDERNDDARDLEGSWNVQVTIRNCQNGAAIRTFPAMNTYMRGGTMQEFGVGSGLLRGPGHGTWSYQSEQRFGTRYSSALQFFRFNADGTPAGRQIVRRQIEIGGVNRFGDAFTATGAVEILDNNGNLIARGCSTETATRFE